MKSLPLRFAIFAAALVPLGAHADTIDAKARPYIVMGGTVVGLFLTGLGAMFILRGLGSRRLARENVAWPTVSGKILSTKVSENIRQISVSNRYVYYVPKARYAYEVGGKRFEGNVIRAGMAQFGYGHEAAALAQLAPYKTGAAVTVRYDPADPSIAVLEAAEYGGARNIFGGVLFAGVGIGGIVLAVWAGSLATH